MKHVSTNYGGSWQAAGPSPLCPGCEGTTIIRSDSGRCERCTAKLAPYRRQWQETRRRAFELATRGGRSYADRDPFCLDCQAVLTGTADSHVCVDTHHVCAYCPRRFRSAEERDFHERRPHAG